MPKEPVPHHITDALYKALQVMVALDDESEEGFGIDQERLDKASADAKQALRNAEPYFRQ